MLEVAEIKALVLYLFTYKTFKKGYKKRTLTTSCVFCFILLMLFFLTIIKYSFSTKKVTSECLTDKTHQQHKKILFLLLNSM